MAVTLEELVTVWKVKTQDEALVKMRSSIDMIKGSLFKLGLIAAGAGAALGTALYKAGQHEQMKITLDVLTGSAEAGKKLLDQLTAFADVTPFETEKVIQYGRTLVGVGFEADRVTDIVKTLGNAAAGVGMHQMPRFISAIATMRSVGKVDFEFLRRLLEAGLPVLEEMANYQGKTNEEMKKMISAGKVSVEDVLSSVKRMTSEGGKYAGLMQLQSKSFLGLISTIKGKLDNLLKEAGQKFLDVWKKLMISFIAWFDLNRKFIKLKIEAAYETLGNVLMFTVRVFKMFYSVINMVVRILGGWKRVIWAVTLALSAGLLIGMGALVVSTYKFIAAVTLATIKMIAFNIVSGGLLLIIGSLIAAFALIAEDFMVWKEGGDSAFGGIYEWIDGLLDKFSLIGSGIKWLMGLAKSFSSTSLEKFGNVMNWVGEKTGLGGIFGGEEEGQSQVPALPIPGLGGGTLPSQIISNKNSVEVNLNVEGMDSETAKELVGDTMKEEIQTVMDETNRETARDVAGNVEI